MRNLHYAYRIVEEGEWAAAVAEGAYQGSSLDARDGFMHLSLASEVLNTARMYYGAHRGPLLVLKVALGKVPGAQLRCDWVESRRAFFPHIVGGEAGYAIPAEAVERVHCLTRGEGGTWEGFYALE